MKLDISTILLVIAAVIPGFFAQRSRNQVVPRSFAPRGASAELAELVALGAATHGILTSIAALILFAIGWSRYGSPDYVFSQLDSLLVSQWASQHLIEAILLLSWYVFISFFVSHLLGFGYGLWKSRSPLTRLMFVRIPWLRKFYGGTLLGERPVVYEVLHPALNTDGTRCVFVEIEMKNALGFYSGQVSRFAIIEDDAQHTPVYLIDVWFKTRRDAEYVHLATDGILIDLADSATMLVRQVDTKLPPAPADM